MTIIENKVEGKESPATCEDGIAVSDDFIAVVDGSTSKTPHHISPNMSNGRYAMQLIKKCVVTMPPNLSCHEFCDLVTQCIRNTCESAGTSIAQLRQHPEERLTASAAVFSRVRQEVWLVGDCQCLIDTRYAGNPKPSEAIAASERARVVEEAIRQGSTLADIEQHDPGRAHILPLLLQGMKGQNLSYAVIDGFPVYEAGVRIISTAGASQVVLASDGYPFLCPTLEESERRLRQQLASDPLCIRTFKATKGLRCGNASFDDRAYIRFRND